MSFMDEREIPDLERTITRRARKPYKCSACGGDIIVGQLYHHRSVLVAGDWFVERFHTHPCEYDDYVDEDVHRGDR